MKTYAEEGTPIAIERFGRQLWTEVEYQMCLHWIYMSLMDQKAIAPQGSSAHARRQGYPPNAMPPW